jgi:hypothetical protein
MSTGTDPPQERRRAAKRWAALGALTPTSASTCAGPYTKLTGNALAADSTAHCPRPSHPDKGPSCDITHSLWYCRSCGAGGDIYSLPAALLELPTRGAFPAERSSRPSSC